MKKRTAMTLAAIIMMVFAWAHTGHTTVRSFEFRGAIAGSGISGVSVGDPFVATLTYDDAQAPFEVGADFAKYSSFSYVLTVAGLTFSNQPGSYILVLQSSLDQFAITGPLPALQLDLRDAAGTTFSSTALPASLSLTDFNALAQTAWNIGTANFLGNITSITPANLALNKTAMASSSKSGHPPGNAVDGSTSTHWRSGTVNSETNAWLRVDLGATFTICSVVINWSGSFYAKKYTVQVSLTGAGGSWTTVHTDNAGNGGIDNITFVPQSGTRYVRVFMTQHNEQVERINEFEVYAASMSLVKASEVAKSEVVTNYIITDYVLEQNYPNPFNPSTTISFALPEAGEVSLAIYNAMGQFVRKLVAGEMAQGRHSIVWDAKDDHGLQMASGMYLYVIKAGDFAAQKKLVLMK